MFVGKKNEKPFDDISAQWEDLGSKEPEEIIENNGQPWYYRAGSVPNTPLPPGWEWKKTISNSKNKVYYINHIRKATYWDDPRPLPYQWEMKTDTNTNKTYFLDHNTRTSTWDDPRPFPPQPLMPVSINITRGASKVSVEPPSALSVPSTASLPSSPRLETGLDSNRAVWVEQLTAMGFPLSLSSRACHHSKLKSVEMVVDWLTKNSDEGALVFPEDEQNPLDMIRALLTQDMLKGIRLTQEQCNLVYLPSHVAETRYECQVCFADDLEINQIVVLSQCKHYLCAECMSKHIIVLCNSKRCASLPCPLPQCPSLIQHDEVHKVLPEVEFTRYQQFLLDDALSKETQCRWCPNPSCGTAMIGDPSIPLMRCPNPSCNFSFCFNCKEKWHDDMSCKQYQEWKKDNKSGDARFVEWAAINTRPCAKCQVAIQKNGGCNHMVCLNCRFEFCWLCMKSVLGDDGKYQAGHWALDEKSPCFEKMHS